MKTVLYYLDWEMPVTERLVLYSLSIFIAVINISAQRHPDLTIDSLLTEGISSVINQRYDSAESAFMLLGKKYPELPLADIYLAGLEIAVSIDYFEAFDDEKINSYLDSAEEKTDRLIDSDPDNLWFNYYMALIKGYLAYYQALRGDIISSLSNGFESIEYFDFCIRTDHKFYESYLALGTYNYWRSAKTESLHWLPFVDDDRGIAINLLENAVDSSSYNHYLALYSLVWIYIDQKNYEKAEKTALQAINKFPESRFFKWALASAQVKSDPVKAFQTYESIYQALKRENKLNYFSILMLKHKMAMQSYNLKDFKNALKLCEEILSIKDVPENIPDIWQERVENVKKLRENCYSKLQIQVSY